jgi:hypothetical protein
MADTTCKHGVRLDRSCIKCGRYLQLVDDTYKAKQAQFFKSIQELEAAMKPFMEEVEKAKQQAAEIDRAERGEEPPPDRPWYRKH